MKKFNNWPSRQIRKLSRFMAGVGAVAFLFSGGLYAQTYCTPSGPQDNTDDITNFTLANINNNSVSGASANGNGYSDYTSTVAAGNLLPFQSYVATLFSGPGSGAHGAAIWIDYNDDGVFQPGEMVANIPNSIQGGTMGTFPQFTVLDSPGLHRLRVEYAYLEDGVDLDPCTVSTIFSEVEDYMVNVATVAACAGQPVAGHIDTTAFSICAENTFSLTDTGATGASGMTYQWQQRSPVGSGAWTNISGGNSFTLNMPNGISTQTEFRFYLVCNASSLSDTSSAVTISLNPSTQCYCVPVYVDGCDFGDEISGVVLNGANNTSINNTNSGCSPGGYMDYTSTVAPVSLVPGQAYNITVSNTQGNANFDAFRAWIDYNQDGTFESNEEIAASDDMGNGSITLTFTVPPTTMLAGITRLRVRDIAFASGSSIDPCLSDYEGEAEDYAVNIVALSACSGAPVAGLIDTTATFGVCALNPFSLSDTGATTASGMTYQWQQKTANGSWTNISGANAFLLNEANGISDESDFRFYVVCNASGLSDTSNSIHVTINPGSQCYCTPTYSFGCQFGDEIDDVSLNGANGTSINNTNSGCSTGGYQDYTSTLSAVDLIPGQSYNLTIGNDQGSSQWEAYRVWIDFNNDGIFDSTETIGSGDGMGSGSVALTFTVPVNATAATTRLRIRDVSFATGAFIDPCDNEDEGETEDYSVHIIALTPCAGAPAAGTIDTASSFGVCASVPFSLSDTGATTASGMVYQWQQRTPAGTGTWTDISGANSFLLNMANGIADSSDFRFYVVCIASNLADTSASVLATINPGIECYCTPAYDVNCTQGDEISNVTLNGNSVSLNNTTSCSANGYGDYTTLPAPDLIPGLAYHISISTDYGTPGDENARAWIDWNGDGIFEPSEMIADVSAIAGQGLVNGTQTFTFVVPPTTTPGNHRLRVRLAYYQDDIQPCDDYTYGEAEDYNVNVIALVPCAGQPNAGQIDTAATFGVCGSVPFILSDTGFSIASNMTYQWQQKIGTGSWTDITGANAGFLNIAGGINDPTSYRFYVVCNGSNLSDTSDAVDVTINAAISCYCVPTSTSTVFGITLVQTTGALVNINHASASGEGYVNNSDSLFVAQVPGDTVNFTVNVTPTMGVGIWVDWNNNGSFGDAGEEVYNSNSYVSSATGSFTVPATATLGMHRMRVVANFFASDPIPCDDLGSSGDGEAEDYGFSVGAPSCNNTADSLTALSVGSTSAALTWTGTAQEYLIEYGAPGFALGSGTQVVANTNPDTLTGLNPNSDYEFYVQNICYPGIDSADWSATPGLFHTICDTPLVNLGADTTICEGQPLTLSTGNSNNGNTYLWSDGSTDSTLSVSASGTYWVSLISQFDCTNTDSIQITVTPLPHVDDITAVHNGDDSYTFTANNVVGAVNYNWDFGDGQGFSSSAHPTYLYGNYGDYTVTLVISNACGSDTTQLIVHYTPEGIGNVDPGKNQLKLYPNPAKDIVTLKNESNQKMQIIEVYNVLGQRVFRGDAQGNETYQLHVDGYASGMYSVKIFFKDGTWTQRKFEIAK